MNKNLGFAFLPILIGLGLLIAGAGASAVITKKIYSTSPATEITTPLSDDTSENETDTKPQQQENVRLQGDSDLNTSLPIPELKDISTTEVPVEVTKQVVTTPKKIEQSIENITPVQTEVKSTDYGDLIKLSESLTLILADIKKSADNKKSNNQKNLTLCKESYDSAMQRVESQWNSDLSYYESQKSYYNSNSGLYNLVGTSQDNNDYLQAQYETFSDKKEAGTASAKATYESCKNSYVFDSSIYKDISSIESAQKDILSRKLSENKDGLISEMQSLIYSAEKLKYTLMLSF